MARHFNGFVNRFSQGRRSLSPGDRQAATSLLQKSGVSPMGIRQFLDGDTVSDAGDRRALAGVVSGLLDQISARPGDPAPLLLPAVQRVRNVPTRTRRLNELGLSASGAQQFLTGAPVAAAGDRQLLREILVAASSGSP